MVLAMDDGQFCLDGGLGDIDNEIDLLEQGQAEQPSAGDGAMLVVLCPNNFEMSVDVQAFDRARCPIERRHRSGGRDDDALYRCGCVRV